MTEALHALFGLPARRFDPDLFDFDAAASALIEGYGPPPGRSTMARTASISRDMAGDPRRTAISMDCANIASMCASGSAPVSLSLRISMAISTPAEAAASSDLSINLSIGRRNPMVGDGEAEPQGPAFPPKVGGSHAPHPAEAAA